MFDPRNLPLHHYFPMLLGLLKNSLLLLQSDKQLFMSVSLSQNNCRANNNNIKFRVNLQVTTGKNENQISQFISKLSVSVHKFHEHSKQVQPQTLTLLFEQRTLKLELIIAGSRRKRVGVRADRFGQVSGDPLRNGHWSLVRNCII